MTNVVTSEIRCRVSSCESRRGGAVHLDMVTLRVNDYEVLQTDDFKLVDLLKKSSRRLQTGRKAPVRHLLKYSTCWLSPLSHVTPFNCSESRTWINTGPSKGNKLRLLSPPVISISSRCTRWLDRTRRRLDQLPASDSGSGSGSGSMQCSATETSSPSRRSTITVTSAAQRLCITKTRYKATMDRVFFLLAELLSHCILSIGSH